MKTIMRIAIECSLEYDIVRNATRSNGLIGEKISGKIYLNEYQEDYLHNILYFEGKLNELTIESKLNNLKK